MKQTYIYLSSWKKKTGDFGLTEYRFHPETGRLEFIGQVEWDTDFGVTHYDPKRGVLYALEEAADLPDMRGGGGGRIFVFRVDPESGSLTRIGCTETWCANPCHLTLDTSGKFLLVAHHGTNAAVTKLGRDARGNYYPVVERDDAAVELFAVNQDGTLGNLLDAVVHEGCGPEKRQAHARPHSAVMSPSGRLFAVCDKGNDTVGMYRLDETKGKLIPPEHIYRHKPGTLPRHCVFHPHKPWFYHNTENTPFLHGFTYTEDGLLEELGAWSAHPDGPEGKCEQQGLVMDHAGKYLYDIVRGPNVVTVFEVDQTDGSLKAVQHQMVNDPWPRSCALSPDGKFLLVCCFGSGEALKFAVGTDGRLIETGIQYPVTSAAWATFCEIDTP